MTAMPTGPPARSAAVEASMASLSPSRAAEFKSCGLMYRFRSIDRLPETPSAAATRGTLVHAVLDALFDRPAEQRTLDTARGLLPGAWESLLAAEPSAGELFADDPDGHRFTEWLASAADLLANYFVLEDPTGFEPAAREQYVEMEIDGVRLRGCVDRLDRSSSGDLRVVDYKTGAAPEPRGEARALFQLKFYALVVWRTRGVVPRELRLIYLGDLQTLTYSPDADELAAFERTVLAIWAAIRRAWSSGDFEPNPGIHCRWCDFRAHCPVFGGTPPPYPARPVLVDPRDAGAEDDRELT